MNLVLKNLRLRQGAFLLELDLEVSGRVIGIFGSSGAGKTTLLEIVAGLRKPNSGMIRLDEQLVLFQDARVNPPAQPCRVGYVPQDLALFPHLSVRKNVLYGHKPETAISVGINLDHVVKVLEIDGLLDRPISALSGGQRQRVAFARALLASPRLLLMDEPLASLDQELKEKIIPYLQRIRDEFQIPMLYVSHSPDEIAALCDQVIVMRAGKCICLSKPAEIFEESTSMALRPGIYDSSK
jgi:molybdate transport system ATP-binding protein